MGGGWLVMKKVSDGEQLWCVQTYYIKELLKIPGFGKMRK